MNRLVANNNRRDTYVVCCFSNPFVKVQTRMDAIKAKMKKLTSENEEATVKANKFDAEARQASGEAEKIEHSLAVLQRKYQSQVDFTDIKTKQIMSPTTNLYIGALV